MATLGRLPHALLRSPARPPLDSTKASARYPSDDGPFFEMSLNTNNCHAVFLATIQNFLPHYMQIHATSVIERRMTRRLKVIFFQLIKHHAQVRTRLRHIVLMIMTRHSDRLVQGAFRIMWEDRASRQQRRHKAVSLLVRNTLATLAEHVAVWRALQLDQKLKRRGVERLEDQRAGRCLLRWAVEWKYLAVLQRRQRQTIAAMLLRYENGLVRKTMRAWSETAHYRRILPLRFMQVSDRVQWRLRQFVFAAWAIEARKERSFLAIEDRAVGRWLSGFSKAKQPFILSMAGEVLRCWAGQVDYQRGLRSRQHGCEQRRGWRLMADAFEQWTELKDSNIVMRVRGQQLRAAVERRRGTEAMRNVVASLRSVAVYARRLNRAFMQVTWRRVKMVLHAYMMEWKEWVEALKGLRLLASRLIAISERWLERWLMQEWRIQTEKRIGGRNLRMKSYMRKTGTSLRETMEGWKWLCQLTYLAEYSHVAVRRRRAETEEAFKGWRYVVLSSRVFRLRLVQLLHRFVIKSLSNHFSEWYEQARYQGSRERLRRKLEYRLEIKDELFMDTVMQQWLERGRTQRAERRFKAAVVAFASRQSTNHWVLLVRAGAHSLKKVTCSKDLHPISVAMEVWSFLTWRARRVQHSFLKISVRRNANVARDVLLAWCEHALHQKTLRERFLRLSSKWRREGLLSSAIRWTDVICRDRRKRAITTHRQERLDVVLCGKVIREWFSGMRRRMRREEGVTQLTRKKELAMINIVLDMMALNRETTVLMRADTRNNRRALREALEAWVELAILVRRVSNLRLRCIDHHLVCTGRSVIAAWMEEAGAAKVRRHKLVQVIVRRDLAATVAVFNNWRVISARSLYIRVGLQRLQLRSERSLAVDVLLEWRREKLLAKRERLVQCKQRLSAVSLEQRVIRAIKEHTKLAWARKHLVERMMLRETRRCTGNALHTWKRRWELEEVSRRSKLVAQQHHAWIGRWQARMSAGEQPSMDSEATPSLDKFMLSANASAAPRSARSTGVHVTRETPLPFPLS